ncbi:MAG: hypothetical protein JWO36_5195 [Myxococcales bacterium]|nr:hypothetical protein [Myxococcales bacterium]
MSSLPSVTALVGIALAAGCLSVPDGPAPMCSTTADCNGAAGEVCLDGVCWGNPPAGPFAAALGAPADRTDVVATELPLLTIPSDGWLGDLALDSPIKLSGRLDAFCPPLATCNQSTIGATITVTRDSLFPGGPGFRKAFTAKADIPAGKAESFSLFLPRTKPQDPMYRVVILPDGRGDMPQPNGAMSAAELVPPVYLETATPDSIADYQITMGGSLPTITGSLADAYSQALTNYRVVAMGHWAAGDPLTEVSTIDYTSDGHYSITLSDHLVGGIEIVAKPWGSTVVAPTLHLGVDAVPAQRNLAQPTGLGNRIVVTIPIKGVSGNGAVVPTSGAKVIVTGNYVAPPLSGGTRAELTVETVTDADGNANITLLDGPAIAGSYRYSVIPPAGSSLGVVYDQPLTLGSISTVRLPARLALSGTVLDSAGNPLGKISVTARPSLRFQWSLDNVAQQFLAAIPAATTITADTGDFVVYVDPLVADIWGHYDLDCEPPLTTDAPSWTVSDIAIDRVVGQTSKSLDFLRIPDAAYIHGRITNFGGEPVEKAELRVFQVVSDLTLCDQVTNPGDCVIPAQLQGHGTSNADGTAWLTLPRR